MSKRAMAKLLHYLDADEKGCWANIVMDDGSPCWIGVTRSGVLIKRSKIGLFGRKLYEEKDISRLLKLSGAVNQRFPDTLAPPEMRTPALRVFTNVVLHCSTADQVVRVLSELATETE